jgi:hypothetical protein
LEIFWDLFKFFNWTKPINPNIRPHLFLGPRFAISKGEKLALSCPEQSNWDQRS